MGCEEASTVSRYGAGEKKAGAISKAVVKFYSQPKMLAALRKGQDFSGNAV